MAERAERAAFREEPEIFPTGWARSALARATRRIILSALFQPLIRFEMKVSVGGAEILETLTPPILMAANHASHVDTPLILISLPPSWRDRTAVAAASDYFFESRWLGVTTALAFGAFPVERRGSRRSHGVARELLSNGYNVLVYPEGTRSVDGVMGPFRHGAARLSIELGIPMLPVAVVGTHRAMPKGQWWPAPGRPAVEVGFGRPVHPEPDDIGRTLSLRVRESIADLIART